MNPEQLKEMVDNCMSTEHPESAASEILWYAQYNDVPKIIEILITKIKENEIR